MRRLRPQVFAFFSLWFCSCADAMFTWASRLPRVTRCRLRSGSYLLELMSRWLSWTWMPLAQPSTPVSCCEEFHRWLTSCRAGKVAFNNYSNGVFLSETYLDSEHRACRALVCEFILCRALVPLCLLLLSLSLSLCTCLSTAPKVVTLKATLIAFANCSQRMIRR